MPLQPRLEIHSCHFDRDEALKNNLCENYSGKRVGWLVGWLGLVGEKKRSNGFEGGLMDVIKLNKKEEKEKSLIATNKGEDAYLRSKKYESAGARRLYLAR